MVSGAFGPDDARGYGVVFIEDVVEAKCGFFLDLERRDFLPGSRSEVGNPHVCHVWPLATVCTGSAVWPGVVSLATVEEWHF